MFTPSPSERLTKKPALKGDRYTYMKALCTHLKAFRYTYMKTLPLGAVWPDGWGSRAKGAVFLEGGEYVPLLRNPLNSFDLPSCLPEEGYQMILVP